MQFRSQELRETMGRLSVNSPEFVAAMRELDGIELGAWDRLAGEVEARGGICASRESE